MSIQIPKPDDVLTKARKTQQQNINDYLENYSKSIDLNIRVDEHNTRATLITYLASISVLWLFFTALVIIFQGFDYYHFTLSNTIIVTFLTTSLGTVLGLWGIGIGYYFFRGNAPP